MFKTLDPEAWVILGMGVLLVILSVTWWSTDNKLKVCTAEYAGFTAKTQAAGEIAEKNRQATETALASAAVNIQGDLNETRVNRDKRYADFQRLLSAAKAAGASSSRASDTSDPSPRLSCSNASAELNSRMAGFEAEVVGTILKSRDEAIERNIACKHYIEQITTILGEKK